mgnify:FL=1
MEVFKVLKYFSFFSYYPTFEEIYTFYPKAITRKQLKIQLLTLVRKKRIYYEKKSQRYTLGGYSIRDLKSQILNVKTKFVISQKKISSWRFRLYIKLLSLFSQIKLIGLSGSIAMMNAKEEDDIDLFIITSQNRLFTGRFIAIILAKILGIHRGYQDIQLIKKLKNQKDKKLDELIHFKNKVCLNLFFDQKNLKIPSKKHSLYVAHEVLQMKPLVNKDNIYERFLKTNRWIFSFFPNARRISHFKSTFSNQSPSLNFKNGKLRKNFLDWLENQLKKFQLRLIKKHQTTEIISDQQLWFHSDDFEKKIKV